MIRETEMNTVETLLGYVSTGRRKPDRSPATGGEQVLDAEKRIDFGRREPQFNLARTQAFGKPVTIRFPPEFPPPPW